MFISTDSGDILIPDGFKTRIWQFFGTRGKEWLSRLDVSLNRCIQQWQLTDCQLADHLSANLVCFAESPQYGPVVLKIGVPDPEVYAEMTALSLYNGRKICCCLEQDVEKYAMLLERVLPGHDLTTLNGKPECLDIAADLIATLHIPIDDDQPSLPKFSDWLNRAFSRVRREQKIGGDMIRLVEQAEQHFRDLERDEPRHVLLHGDLHHTNILCDQQGQWKAIDPKGVIGVPCLETGRFIQNHLSYTEKAERPRVFDDLLKVLSAACERPKKTIAICALIDCVLSRCWTFEEHLTPEEITAAAAEAVRSGVFYSDAISRL